MKYKYEFEIDDDFERGYCPDCPLSYYNECDDGYDVCCVLNASYDECPLVEVK